MKRVATLICICIIIGLVEHVQEVGAHKTLDVSDEGESGGEGEHFGGGQQAAPSGDPDGAAPEAAETEAGAGSGPESAEKVGAGSDFKQPEPSKKPLKEQVIAFFQHEPMWYWKYYKFELGCLAVFAVAIANFIKGKGQNQSIAIDWSRSNVTALAGQFAHLGCSQESRSVALMQRSYSDYEYFASGRKNCYYAHFKLALKHRHCLLTTCGYDLMQGTVDTLTIEVPIDVQGRDLPLEFFICRRKDWKQKASQLTHLADLVQGANAKNYRLSEKQLTDRNALVIQAEHDEIANQLIDAKAGEVLLKYGSSGVLHELHITDQRVYNNCPLFLRAVIELPSGDDEEKAEAGFQLLQLAIHMIDLAAGLKLSPGVASKCEKARKKGKQAAAQAKRDEQEEKRAEARREQERLERERLKRMTPEQQKKYEEKQRKKEQQKTKSKFMKIAKV